MQIPRTLRFSLLGLAAVASLSATERTFRSGPDRVALIELYTSEGCSSCPPAEAWLGELRRDAGLWRDFVPVAFHVNYWDRLGWTDVLASKAFTQRQYVYAAAWNAASVYTPCVVRNGAEWQLRDVNVAAVKLGKMEGETGTLSLAWDSATQTCRVEFAPAAAIPTDDLAASIALLGGGIVSDVRKGENAGRKLRHDFVALRLETVPLTRGPNGIFSGTTKLLPRADVKAERLALAGWTHSRDTQKPYQATGGWIQ